MNVSIPDTNIEEEPIRDRVFNVNLERSRVYWDYYKSMFIVFSFCLMAGMLCTTAIYVKGDIGLVPAVGVILLLFLCVILLAALMSLSIWRHENKHLDEMIAAETEPMQGPSPPEIPLS